MKVAKIKLYTTIGNAYLAYAKDLEGMEAEVIEETTEAKVGNVSKKTSKKTTKKTKKVEAEARTFFTNDEPPQTAKEMELFHKQWSGMTPEQQQDYLAGVVGSNIVSLQEKVEEHAEEKKVAKKAKKTKKVDKPVEAIEDLDELEDLGEDYDEKEYTVEEVRTAARDCAKRIGKNETYAILENFGSKKVAEIDPSNFSELMQELGN